MKKFLTVILSIIAFHLSAQLTEIAPTDLATGDSFGFTIDIEDDELVITASRSDALSNDAGAIYHYTYNGSEWELNQRILPNTTDGVPNSNFGQFVSMSENWIAASIKGVDQIGSVIFYKKENGEWVEHSQITNGVANTFFGWSIHVEDDLAVVGAVADSNPSGDITGAAYIYEYNAASDTWDEVAKLFPDEHGSFFGSAVHIQDDLVAVTDRFDYEQGIKCGAVYVFGKNQGTWTQTAKLIPDDAGPDDLIGYRIDGDGNRLIMSGYGDDNETGSVYIFRNENGWIQEARLYADDLSEGDWFGSDISIVGERAIVGARHHSGNEANSGAVYLFERENATWVQKNKFLPPDGQSDAGFGCGLDYENNNLVIGAFSAESNGTTDTGAAYAITLEGLVAVKDLNTPSFTIYPNPSHDEFILDLGNDQADNISIYTITGQLVKTLKSTDRAISIVELEAGIYILKVSTREGQELMKRFVKI